MSQRARSHWADVKQALAANEPEKAAGHALAAFAASPASQAKPDLNASVALALLARSLKARAANDIAETIRLLSLYYGLTKEPTALNRLLHDVEPQRDPALTLRLASEMQAISPPYSYLSASAFYFRTFAEHCLAGVDMTEAQRLATAQTVVYLDIALQSAPLETALLTTRVEKNGELRRYGAVIEDLRRLHPDRIGSSFVARSICFNLRHVAHPEARAAIDFLMRDPPDDMSGLFELYTTFVAMAAMKEANDVAARLQKWLAEYAAVGPLQAMADDVDQRPAAELGIEPSGRHLIYANIVCWGSKYLDLLANVALPSLLAPNNLPALAADNDVVLEIITNLVDLGPLLAMPAIQDIATICRVRIYCFPPDIQGHQNRIPYVTFGYGGHCTILRAQKHGADLLFLLPDVIYPDGCLRYIAGLVTREKRVLFTDGLNAQATALIAQLAPFRSPDGRRLAISPAALCDLAAPLLMTRTRENFYSPSAAFSPKLPARLVFQDESGIVVHSFHKLPMYASHASFADIRYFHYTTPDGAFVESLMNNLTREQALNCDSADELMIVEINDEAGAVSPPSPLPLIESITEYFRDFYYSERLYWNFETGVRYRLKPIPDAPFVTEDEKNACLAKVRELFATHSIFVDWGRERDKVRRLEFGDGATSWSLAPTEETNSC